MQRILILIVVSLVIFEARPHSWAAMLVAAAIGLAASRRLPGRETAPLHPARMLRFGPWFLLQSLLGGVDVARRAFRGSAALRPALVEHTTRIRSPVVRVILANTVSLMPGTLTARLEDDRLLIHVLDDASDVHDRMRRVESRVARAFGEAS